MAMFNRFLRYVGSLLALLLVVQGCESVDVVADSVADAVSDDAEVGTDVGDIGNSASDVLVGMFVVKMTAPVVEGSEVVKAGKTSFIGAVSDGPSPLQVIYEQYAAEGQCVFYKPRIPFCSTSCGEGVCVEDEICMNYPNVKAVGLLHVTGLMTSAGSSDFTLEDQSGNYQAAGETGLAYPAFAEGDTISVAAEGSDFADAFSLQVNGISQLVLTGDSYVLDGSTPLDLKWTAPIINVESSIGVVLDISHHGGTKGKIECRGVDNGELVVPASLIGELLDLGASGYPSVIVTRTVSDYVTIPAGKVGLEISSGAEHQVVVPGITSCTDDSQCEDGQTCQTDLVCR